MPASLISVTEARQKIAAAVTPLPAESVALGDALGRVLARDAVASQDLPPFASSAMDGFALIAGAAGELEIVGESRAGHPADVAVETGQAVRISTGAVVPLGADAVVPVERVEESDGRVRVAEVQAGANVRGAGEDVRAGETVIRAGTEIGPAELGVLSSLGLATVECSARPRVVIVATGDELRPPGETLRPGEIHDSNAPALAAQARLAGADVVAVEHARDTEEAVRGALERALDAADLLLVSGGVSVGPHDHVKPVLSALGVEEGFWGVKLKPGKPTWFGTRGAQLVFGLPGNPVSAMVTFRLFAHPALRALQGADPGTRRASAVLDESVTRSPERDQAIRVRLEAKDDGWHARPTKAQGSHVLTSMLGAGALAIVEAGEGELAAGARVELELL